MTDNDNHLHILGGQSSAKHIVMNLNTNKYQSAHDFDDTNPNIQQQMVLFNRKLQKIYMFGGINIKGNTEFSDFWICDIKIDEDKMTKILYSWSRYAMTRDSFVLPMGL